MWNKPLSRPGSQRQQLKDLRMYGHNSEVKVTNTDGTVHYEDNKGNILPRSKRPRRNTRQA